MRSLVEAAQARRARCTAGRAADDDDLHAMTAAAAVHDQLLSGPFKACLRSAIVIAVSVRCRHVDRGAAAVVTP
jgi:hypothetical protein